jgi:hypothetical protein
VFPRSFIHVTLLVSKIILMEHATHTKKSCRYGKRKINRALLCCTNKTMINNYDFSEPYKS